MNGLSVKASLVFSTLTWLLLLGTELVWLRSGILIAPILISSGAVATSAIATAAQQLRQIEYKPVECFHVWGKWSELKFSPHALYPHSQPGSHNQTRSCEECGFIEKRIL